MTLDTWYLKIELIFQVIIIKKCQNCLITQHFMLAAWKHGIPANSYGASNGAY